MPDDLGTNLSNLFRKIRGLPEVNKETINAILKELQRALIMADVRVEDVFAATDSIKKKAMDDKINTQTNRKDYIITLLHDELIKLLGGNEAPKRIKTGRETVILMIGIQGSGKTTTVGKLAKYYHKRGFKLGVVCTDTWRPGAYDQLAQLCDSVGVDHYGNPGEKNALKLARKGLKKFRKEKKDLIIVDTAGRHKQETELMKEMSKLENIIKPNETILVIDGTLGQQAYAQATAFAQTTTVGSIIITKLDGSAKGGGALSAAAASKAPIKFVGEGERMDDLDEFHPTKYVGSLLGIPDIEGLIEKVKELELEPDDAMANRIMKGKFTLDDLYQQLLALKKLGPMSKILGMMGGKNIPKEAKEMAEGNLDKWKVVLGSITQEEKENPDLIRKTRITRIARGSGCTYTEIKGMLKQYETMKKFIPAMMGAQKGRRGKKGGAMPGMPNMAGGMPNMGDMQEMAKQMQQGKKKRKKHPW